MTTARSIISLILAMLAGLTFLSGCTTSAVHVKDVSVIHLLNEKDLNTFYTFLNGYGTNDDPEGVFTLTNGMLRISGQDFGYLATRREYSDYRLVAEFKWDDVTWAPRQFNARESGILINMTGDDQLWPRAVECMIGEGATGDILVVNGALLTVDGVTKGPRTERFDRPGRNPWKDELGFRGPNEMENPQGEWNTLQVVSDGGKVSIMLNGQKTLEGTNAKPDKGKILLQSAGAELFFRRLDLYPLR